MNELEKKCILTSPICERVLGEEVRYGSSYEVKVLSHPAPSRTDGNKYTMIGFTEVGKDPNSGWTVDYCVEADHGLKIGDTISGEELFNHARTYRMTNFHTLR